jgi:hypothetical protein
MDNSLVDKLLKSSQKIHQSSLRGSGNYIIVNSSMGRSKEIRILKIFLDLILNLYIERLK